MLNRKVANSRDSTVTAVFVVAGLILLMVAWWVYQPGINGPLLLDDWPNLSVLENAPVNDWNGFRSFVFGNASGPAGRPVSMLSFLLDGRSWPIDVASSKQTNILIHLLCALSLLALALCVFRSLGLKPSRIYLLAFLSVSIWVLHPLNVSTVLYLIQRMTQLVTLFSMLALICFFVGRVLVIQNVAKGMSLLLLALFPFGLLAVLAKENGVLLLASFVIIEWTLFQKLETNKAYAQWFRFGVVLPLCLLAIYLAATSLSSIEGYDFRSFSLLERLLTEPRILIHYLSNIFFPLIGNFGLYHDDIVVSTTLWRPLTTILSLACVLILLVLSVRMRIKEPMFSFAVLWFFVWHFLESSYLPLELYFEHRNYLPMIGPILAGTYYLMRAVDLVSWKYFPRFMIAWALIGVLFLSSLTFQLTRLWGGSGALISHWAEQHPQSIRAQSDLAVILADIGGARQGLTRLQSLLEFYPKDISLHLQIFNYSCSNNLPVQESLQQIANIENPELSHIDINVPVREMIDNLRLGACAYPAQLEMINLMDTINDLKMNSRVQAILDVLYSELLVHYELIDAALLKLDQAFEQEPSVDIAIRQSTLAGSVGRFEQALEILNKATSADELRGFLLPSRRDEIDGWRKQIEALQ